ncbi:hypothetical protein [Rhodoplanes sp. Z2-YC6860]|uniref:hypothetical protein n=1 Tax=Rhodoplanes sp. Z2-YC6860 TaxID=674703 RepID=UPI000831CF26|nr:hypothetical protein [Rhodoplanes sp. Z2-YC6860]
MPLYRFGINELVLTDEPAEWHPDDVAAMQAAANVTAELVRNRGSGEPTPLVMAFRVKVDA